MSSRHNQRITVYVNGEPRRTFLGLRVRHVVGHPLVRSVEHGAARVEDDEGNRVDLDGALYDGQRLYLQLM